MQKHLKFLKISSVIVKVTAWSLLLLGVFGGVSTIMGFVPGYPRWMGFIVLAIYAFSFFFCYLVAKMADLLRSLIKEAKEE